MQQKGFLQQILERAKAADKHIVLPEGDDLRTIEAAAKVVGAGVARLTILGDTKRVESFLKIAGAKSGKIALIDPEKSEKLSAYAKTLFELRKNKGLTLEQAKKTLLDPVYFGTMMVKVGDADGLVAGAIHATPDTIRPALQIIKAAAGINTVSSMFFMCKGEKVYLFADCGLVENPNAEELADIATSTVRTAIQFGFVPRVAMLSYSTKGSASGEGVLKVASATELARKKISENFGSDVIIDGELQFDAAIVPAVAKKKCPASPVAGQANILIFPDLGAGNIAYKLAERMGECNAYGPILQGLAKPVNDLSRGCNSDDIVATIAITAIQAQK